MAINVIARRQHVQRIIARDPWAITAYRPGRTPDSSETSWEFTGTIKASGARGAPLEALPSVSLQGEGMIARYGWVLLAPYDTPVLKERDTITAVQTSSGNTRYFEVVYCGRYTEKLEVILDERQ